MDARKRIETINQLVIRLERIKNKTAVGEERTEILDAALQSHEPQLLRLIPLAMKPLSDDEKDILTNWAEDLLVEEKEHSKLWLVTRLLVRCAIPALPILDILDRSGMVSRDDMERIEEILDFQSYRNRWELLNRYLKEKTEALLASDNPAKRDGGKHVLINIAETQEEWQGLAGLLLANMFQELRQGVLEHFLWECLNPSALFNFIQTVVNACLDKIALAAKCGSEETMWMHWIISCSERLGAEEKLACQKRLFLEKFGRKLPDSIRGRLGIATLTADEILTQPPRNHRPQEPTSVELALREGWTIKSESGSQVILTKNGKSITRHRRKK